MSRLHCHTAHVDRLITDGLPPIEQQSVRHYEHAQQWVSRSHLNLVQELLDNAAAKGFADLPLLRDPSTTLSYAQTLTRVNQMARVLTEDLGLVPGNRVLLRGPNSIGMALAWLAVVKAGCIAVATMPLLRAPELRDILSKAKPSAALCDIHWMTELELALQELGQSIPILPFNVVQHPDGLATRSAQKDSHFAACPTLATDPALMAFTSGTTGKPKAVVHTHLDVLAACEAWPRFVLQPVPDDIIMGSPPLAFTFGLGGLLLFPMWAGASVYFHDVPLSPEAMLQVIRDQSITICYTAPTFYRQLAIKLADDDRGVGQLRICVSAGEALPVSTRQQWLDVSGLDILDGIGATEMFHIFISSTGADLRAHGKLGAIGKAVPGYKARVVDDAGQDVPVGIVGRLAVQGPTGCQYFADDRQSKYVKTGWNYPGDTFKMDADGYFYYQSRDDDMIITAGYNVGAPEVEDCLLKHPALAEVAVIGDLDVERGMVIHAFCVMKTGASVTVQELQDHVKKSIAPYKYPRRITFVDKLPRTETGKLQRFKLRTFHASTTTTT
jgi:2-aminobenzoate-CoA ligase